MDRVADRSGDDLAVDVGIVGKDLADVADQVQCPAGDVVQTAEERADIGGAGTRGQQSLIGGEDQVQLVGMPSEESTLMALRPSTVIGILTTMCLGSSL